MYFVLITPHNAGCEPIESPAVVFDALAPPTVDIQPPSTACAGEEIAFSQQSSGDGRAALSFSWNFGDGSLSPAIDATHAYENPGTYEVSLMVSYESIQLCTATSAVPVYIVTPVTPLLTASAASICQGEAVTLSVDGVFNEITWEGGQSGTLLEIRMPGEYKVSTVDLNGCTSVAGITVTQKPVPVLTVSADKQVIAAGQSVQLYASGADTYSWSPGKIMNDSTLADPIASPESNTMFILTGSLVNGCSATANLAIEVSGEVLAITVPILFSPNGDDANEVLVIEGVDNYQDCSLTIFDKRGGSVFETIGYKNNWDGTLRGTPVPEGVYYYVFGCPNKKPLAGTVTVIR